MTNVRGLPILGSEGNLGMPDEAATTELIRSIYADLASHRVDGARAFVDDEILDLVERYDEQFREFQIEPL